MVNIEVRQNGIFKLGYPYNSKVDDYFQSLNASFIKNYGLQLDTIQEINDYKHKSLEFDREIHEFVLELSSFIIGYDDQCRVLIDTFDKDIKKESELKKRLDGMLLTKGLNDQEFSFIIDTVERLRTEATTIEEFITYFNSQLLSSPYSYNESYIGETESTILLLRDLISQNDRTFEHYKATLFDHVDEMVEIKTRISEKNFIATSLRTIYEEWKKRPEQHYVDLVENFTVDYDQHWTYGTSMMYGQLLKEGDASTEIYNSIASRWQQSLFKRYDLTLELEMKEYSLGWLRDHPQFEAGEFSYAIERHKVVNLRRDIEVVEQLINDKKRAVSITLPQIKEDNYYKYRELVLARRHYHHDNYTVDQNIMDTYNSQIATLLPDYEYTTSKFSQSTYWQYYSDWEQHTELLVELRRQLVKSENAIRYEFVRNTEDNVAALEKLEFYNQELILNQDELSALIKMKERIEIENNVSSEAMSRLTQELYIVDASIKQTRQSYDSVFNTRLPFFTQELTEPNVDSVIINIIKGYHSDYLYKKYTYFTEYKSHIGWYTKEVRDNLELHYSNILSLIKNQLRFAWDREFNHPILDHRRVVVYQKYVDEETKLLYGMANKYLLDSKYDVATLDSINKQKEIVKSIFISLIEIATTVNKDILIFTNMFDYEDTLTFTITNNNETCNNMLNTFNAILDDITVFLFNKNLEFKTFEHSIKDMERIDQVWLDMEKNYV